MALGQVSSKSFGFPCHLSSHWLLHIHRHHHLSSGAGTIGQLVADVPSGLSLAPPQETKRNSFRGLHDEVSCIETIGLRIVGWLMNEDELERISKQATVASSRYNAGICLQGLEKTTKFISQDSLRSGRDSNRKSPKYKSRTLPVDQAVRSPNDNRQPVHITKLLFLILWWILSSKAYLISTQYSYNESTLVPDLNRIYKFLSM
jgi:hypothetical protein